MTDEDYKNLADPNCPICEGKGYVEVEDIHHPDDPIPTREYREMCVCALENYEKR
jgi:hypothetical protein